MLPDLPSLGTYGGAMKDYGSVVDPTTDESAIFRNHYVADTVAMARTAAQAIVSFQGVTGATPVDPGSGFIHQAQWGTESEDKPTFVRFGAGIIDITWPTTVADELTDLDASVGGGISHTVTFRRAMAQVESADGVFKAAHAKVTGANTVRVYLYDGTTLNDLNGLIVTVWVW